MISCIVILQKDMTMIRNCFSYNLIKTGSLSTYILNYIVVNDAIFPNFEKTCSAVKTASRFSLTFNLILHKIFLLMMSNMFLSHFILG